jgi:uncharacterized protein YhfF
VKVRVLLDKKSQTSNRFVIAVLQDADIAVRQDGKHAIAHDNRNPIACVTSVRSLKNKRFQLV